MIGSGCAYLRSSHSKYRKVPIAFKSDRILLNIIFSIQDQNSVLLLFKLIGLLSSSLESFESVDSRVILGILIVRVNFVSQNIKGVSCG